MIRFGSCECIFMIKYLNIMFLVLGFIFNIRNKFKCIYLYNYLYRYR